MKHRYFGNHLGRNTKQARALYRSLVVSILDRGRIETTLAKAKSVQGMIDKVINLAKKNTVAAKRLIAKELGTDISLDPKQFAARNSGYTRVLRLGQRFSDTTERVLLELVDQKVVAPVPEPTKPIRPIKKVKKNDKTS